FPLKIMWNYEYGFANGLDDTATAALRAANRVNRADNGALGDDAPRCPSTYSLAADFLELERTKRIHRPRRVTLVHVLSCEDPRSSAAASSTSEPLPRRSGVPPELVAWPVCSTPESPGQC